MKKGSYFKKILTLFWTFFKIGSLTFGGGYAMIPIIQREICDKKKWLSDLEIVDILAISESTPGPIAVNAATFVGFKVAGFFGSLMATLGLAIPSFVIIFVLSFVYDWFLASPIISAAFKGLRIGVIILLIRASIRLAKNLKFNALDIILLSIAIIGTIVTTLTNVHIMIGTFNLSVSLLFILFGLISGVVITAIRGKK